MRQSRKKSTLYLNHYAFSFSRICSPLIFATVIGCPVLQTELSIFFDLCMFHKAKVSLEIFRMNFAQREQILSLGFPYLYGAFKLIENFLNRDYNCTPMYTHSKSLILLPFLADTALCQFVFSQ